MNIKQTGEVVFDILEKSARKSWNKRRQKEE